MYILVKKRRRRTQKNKKVRPQHKAAEAQHPRDSKENQIDLALSLSTPIVANCDKVSSTSAAVNEPVDLNACETVSYL